MVPSNKRRGRPIIRSMFLIRHIVTPILDHLEPLTSADLTDKLTFINKKTLFYLEFQT